MQPLPKKIAPFLWFFIKKQKWLFLIWAILPLGYAIDQNIFPYITKMIVDVIANYSGDRGEIFNKLEFPLMLGLSFWVILILTYRCKEIAEVYFGPKFHANIRMAMVEYTEKHSHSYFMNNFAGSIANKISDMPSSCFFIINFLFGNFFPNIFCVFIAIVILWFISPVFSLIFFLWFFVHMAISIIFSKPGDRLSMIHSESRSDLQGKIVDSLTNIVNIKIFARNRYELSFIKKFQDIEQKNGKKLLWFLTKVKFYLEIPALIMIVATVYYLVVGWRDGWVSTGDFVFTINMSFIIMISIWRMGMEIPEFFKEVGICKQALGLINVPHEIVDAKGAKDLKVKKGEIVFDNVNFEYAEGKNIFKDKKVVIKAGEKVGLVGFSGSGKSTFVNLILRFFDVKSGSILIDGQDISKVTLESLHKNIAMIPQDPVMFHRSLYENIGYGKIEASKKQIIEASKKAYCHNFIETMKEGYESLVGERGIKLSGGQRQRIAIARAILKNAPILILDEATSSLDSVTEKYIQKSIKTLISGKTSIIIAHRLSTLDIVDRILVFDEGQIVEDGTHKELLKKKGHYAKLWDMQAKGFFDKEQGVSL